MGKPDYIDIAVDAFRKLLIDEDLEHFLNTGQEKDEKIDDENDNDGEEDIENDKNGEPDDENNNSEEDDKIDNNSALDDEIEDEKNKINEQMELLKLRKRRL